MFEYLRDFDLKVFGIVAERPTKMPYTGPGVLQTHYRRLLHRVELYMEQAHSKFMALPIFDGQDPASNRVFADCFTGYMVKHSGGKALVHIVPNALFVDSSLTPGIRIADWFAYVIRVTYENNLQQTQPVTDTYLSAMKRFAGVITAKTMNFERPNDFTWYGIAQMSADKFVYEPEPVEAEEDPLLVVPDVAVSATATADPAGSN